MIKGWTRKAGFCGSFQHSQPLRFFKPDDMTTRASASMDYFLQGGCCRVPFRARPAEPSEAVAARFGLSITLCLKFSRARKLPYVFEVACARFVAHLCDEHTDEKAIVCGDILTAPGFAAQHVLIAHGDSRDLDRAHG
jgi:hypothetical protein